MHADQTGMIISRIETALLPCLVTFLTSVTPTALLRAESITVVPKAQSPSKSQSLAKEPKETFDRLDGKGPSGVNAYVVFMNDKMEIRSTPKGRLAEPGLTIDEGGGKGKVLVIEYRFTGLPYRIIRRAPLEGPLKEPFKLYRNLKDKTDDNFLLSNTEPENLGTTWSEVPRSFKPAKMYPDHYESAESEAESLEKNNTESKTQ